MNLFKEESSYSQGMKPFLFSMKKNETDGTNNWLRGCSNMSYKKNSLKTKH